jgi:predicted small lipoprotein YifL
MKRLLIAGISVAALVALAGCTLFYPNNDQNQDPVAQTSLTPSAFPSPTESAEPEVTPSPSPSVTTTKAAAKIQVIYSDTSQGFLEVIAEVTNFAEDGGQCTLVSYSGNTSKVVGTFKAESNVGTTQCFPIKVEFSSLTKGTSTVAVAYESNAYSGESGRFEVNIP